MLRVAYISNHRPEPKGLTAREKLQTDAMAAIANARIRNRSRAKKKFAPEITRLEQLEIQLKKTQYGNH